MGLGKDSRHFYSLVLTSLYFGIGSLVADGSFGVGALNWASSKFSC